MEHETMFSKPKRFIGGMPGCFFEILFFPELTQTQKELQQLARKFTKDEIIPKAAEHDKSGAYPWDIFKKAWSVGLLNSFVPEKYGSLTMSEIVSFAFWDNFVFYLTYRQFFQVGQD